MFKVTSRVVRVTRDRRGGRRPRKISEPTGLRTLLAAHNTPSAITAVVIFICTPHALHKQEVHRRIIYSNTSAATSRAHEHGVFFQGSCVPDLESSSEYSDAEGLSKAAVWIQGLFYGPKVPGMSPLGSVLE